MFVRKLQEEAEQLFQEYIDTPQQLLELTDAELHSFHTAANCHMSTVTCQLSHVNCHMQTAANCHMSTVTTSRLGGDKVRATVENYRGAAQSTFNLAYRISKSEWKLSVVMHNLKGYDGHLIVKALKSEFVEEVRVIPQNM